MPRTLFLRLLTHGALLLAAFVLAAGFAVDRFLVDREVEQLERHLGAQARLVQTTFDGRPDLLQERVLRQGAAAGVRFTVVDGDGTVLADSERDPRGMDNHGTRPEVMAAMDGRLGSAVRVSPTLGVEMLYVAVPGVPVFRAALPLSDVRSLLWQMRRRVLLAALPALVLALALALFLSRGLTGRFSAMRGFASRIAAGDYEAVLSPRGDDELADLERSLAALRDELAGQVGALRRDQERLQALVDGLPDAVVLLDGRGRVTVANDPARRLVRLPREAIEGLPGLEVLRESRLLEVLESFPGADGAPAEPFRVAWPEPACELEVVLRPLPDGKGEAGTLVVLRDVTRQAHLERVRTDFIANLSHELRTPLTAVRASAETLLDGALSDPAAAQRFLDSVRRNALRLEALLADVSDLARIEAGADAFEPRQFDARGTVGQVVELFRAEAAAAGLGLGARLPEDPVPLSSDPDKLESILVNLVQNALRYTPRGGRVEVALAPGPGGTVFVVEDTGLGIPAKDISRVTERFYRVDPGRSRAQGGTGLGLSIVKHLVEVLHGKLRIESEQGRGTTVTVDVPNLPVP